MKSVSELREIFMAYLANNLFLKSPNKLYEPIDYILNIGGKRLRPVLLMAAYDMFDSNIKNALPAAMAIELFHNFSLVHDDIMDEAYMRRGKLTVHKKYDLNTAILSGDAMLIYTYQYLSQIHAPELFQKIVAIFNKLAIQVCEGQQYDVDFETEENISIDFYLKMIELKTAVLVAGAMQIGALLGGASDQDAAHLANFGKNIGIAFQVQDDILDTFGDADTFGKKIGGDIIQGKKTYLVLKALELAPLKQKKKLLFWLANEREEKIEIVKSIFKSLDIEKNATTFKDTYLQKAYANLEKVNVATDKKKIIRELGESLIVRIS